ncbi:hypothetical protein [Desnuesiella massiliensis]|uniref:hypothetical protein n=1 Tax=Desnuesiella massiliensis TaxID=1650662 RepID=UPI0006E1779E|nr:hypothetical protein [Desnuesiella massiliensis]
MKKIVSLLIVLLLSVFYIGCDKKSNVLSTNLNEKETSVVNNIYILKENSSKTKAPIDKAFLKSYNKDAKEDLIGKSEEQVINIYKKPFYEIAYLKSPKDIEPSHKAFIYLPDSSEANADNSALTIIFKDNLVIKYKIDDFNGLHYSSIPDIFNNPAK